MCCPGFVQTTSLSILDLSYNQLSGGQPTSWLLLTQLTRLILSHNKLSDPYSYLTAASGLVYLDYSWNELTTQPQGGTTSGELEPCQAIATLLPPGTVLTLKIRTTVQQQEIELLAIDKKRSAGTGECRIDYMGLPSISLTSAFLPVFLFCLFSLIFSLLF